MSSFVHVVEHFQKSGGSKSRISNVRSSRVSVKISSMLRPGHLPSEMRTSANLLWSSKNWIEWLFPFRNGTDGKTLRMVLLKCNVFSLMPKVSNGIFCQYSSSSFMDNVSNLSTGCRWIFFVLIAILSSYHF